MLCAIGHYLYCRGAIQMTVYIYITLHLLTFDLNTWPRKDIAANFRTVRQILTKYHTVTFVGWMKESASISSAFENRLSRLSLTTEAALLENNEASAKLTTANDGTFTSSSARFSSQSSYSTLDQWLTCFNVIGYWDWLWARRKRSAIWGGKLISVHMIPHDVNRMYGI